MIMGLIIHLFNRLCRSDPAMAIPTPQWRFKNQLRTVVRLMNRILADVEQTKHPYKTFIGRITDRGFDLLGYRIGDRLRKRLSVAWKTWVNHRAKLMQLYEQGASKECVAGYVRRLLIWVRSGVEIDLREVVLGFLGDGDFDGVFVVGFSF